MCSKEATGNEHVPPRCLFPESKDLSPDVDLRKYLITVPACEDHNLAKSQDDEYLLYVLSMNLPANEIAKKQFSTKVSRSITRNPGLIKTLMVNRHTVTVVDNSGKAHKTVAIRIDDPRLNSALDHIARALYFHHFKEQWLGDVKTQPDFLLASLDPVHGQKRNEQSAEMAEGADHLFAECEFHGANPDVFKYQVLDEGGGDKLMRLHFYEGCRVSVFFLGSTPPSR